MKVYYNLQSLLISIWYIPTEFFGMHSNISESILWIQLLPQLKVCEFGLWWYFPLPFLPSQRVTVPSVPLTHTFSPVQDKLCCLGLLHLTLQYTPDFLLRLLYKRVLFSWPPLFPPGVKPSPNQTVSNKILFVLRRTSIGAAVSVMGVSQELLWHWCTEHTMTSLELCWTHSFAECLCLKVIWAICKHRPC